MSASASTRARVVVAGSGVAGLETVLALRDRIGEPLWIELVSPNDGFGYRPLAVAEPFALTPQFEIELASFARETGAELRHDELVSVDPRGHQAGTAAGERLEFDFLVVAVGARALPGLRGAFTFRPEATSEYRHLLYRIERGEVGRVAFVVPEGVGWVLPLYELALMTAAFTRARTAQMQITLVTPEARPLQVFGTETTLAVTRTLREWGVEIVTEHAPVRFEAGQLETAPEVRIPADEVVTLPRLQGPGLPGLPADDGGFIEVSNRGRVPRCAGVFAAGDATTFPVKQGGIAAQQADAAAAAIASELSGSAEPTPFRPTLDAVLLTGEFALHLHRALRTGTAAAPREQVGDAWWPPGKVFARHLSGYLADRGGLGSISPTLRPRPLAEELVSEQEAHTGGSAPRDREDAGA